MLLIQKGSQISSRPYGFASLELFVLHVRQLGIVRSNLNEVAPRCHVQLHISSFPCEKFHTNAVECHVAIPYTTTCAALY